MKQIRRWAPTRPTMPSIRWDLGLGRELGFAFWAMFFLEGSFGSYFAIWPLYIERLGAPVTVVGLVLGASGILRLFVLPPSAALADRIGAKRLIIIARICSLIGVLTAAAAQHWTHLLVMVSLVAVGELAFPMIQAHVAARATGNAVRAFAFVFVVGPSVALGLGPLLSGVLIGFYGLRAALVLSGAFTLCSILCFAMLREMPAPRARRPPETTDGLAEAAPSYRSALGDAAVRRLLALHGLTIFFLALGTAFVPTFLERTRGLTPEQIAQLGALAAVGSVLFGLAVSRLGALQRNPFAGAAGAVVAVAVGLALFVLSGHPVALVVAFIFRGGLFSSWALFAAAMGETAKPRDRPRAFALVELTGGTAFSVAPMVAGTLFVVRPSMPLLVAVAGSAVVAPLLLLAQRAARREQAARLPVAPTVDSS